MKCYEVTKCPKDQRDACFVWNSFRENPVEMENVKCWVLKSVYQEESGEQLKKCKQCAYYGAMNRDAGVAAETDADIAVVTCEGTINAERTKALEKVWDNLKRHNRFKIILDLSQVNNLYSCGLGQIIKIHKDAIASGGALVVVITDAYVANLFAVTKLSRILKMAASRRDAHDIFETVKAKEDTVRRAAASQPIAAPAKPARPKQRPACYDYFKNHNPKNATACDECFKKIKPSGQPCWIVDGMIEGVSFQYVSEDCEDCIYFKEFGPVQA